MPKREPDLLLEDIRSALARIERYTSALDRNDFSLMRRRLMLWRAILK
jgi:uncharacterized protein with HEPN domain